MATAFTLACLCAATFAVAVLGYLIIHRRRRARNARAVREVRRLLAARETELAPESAPALVAEGGRRPIGRRDSARTLTRDDMEAAA